MYAIHMQPDGASYRAEKEEFVARTPLPLTDVAIGPDGSMVFTIGGRGTQSELYRVTYVGDESTAPVNAQLAKGKSLRELRKSIEALHGTQVDPAGPLMELIWNNLGHQDRFIRYAARVALEAQSVDDWRQQLAGEKHPAAVINAVMALARQGQASDRDSAFESLTQVSFNDLSR